MLTHGAVITMMTFLCRWKGGGGWDFALVFDVDQNGKVLCLVDTGLRDSEVSPRPRPDCPQSIHTLPMVLLDRCFRKKDQIIPSQVRAPGSKSLRL